MRLGCVLVWLCALLLTPAGAAAKRGAAKPRVRLAFTIDDLPAAGDSAPEWPKGRILEAIIDTLKKHGVPTAVGFFNGGNLDDQPATREALAHWLAAGFVLGNHTFSHASAERVGAREFEREIERDEALIMELDANAERAGRYFRYPYLERGTAPDEARIRAYLRQHKYRIADVSVDFEDWAFSDAYARCTQKGDATALEALTASYLTFAVAELAWSVETARRLMGRSIPHVLLVHANLMTAQLLDALLSAYERAGAQFIPLEEALRDAAYAHAQTAQHGDTTLIVALERERRAHLRSFVPLPESLLQVLCR